MRMETNHEDSQLMREAARSAWRRAVREKQISDIVAEHLTRLHTALREDFHLTDADVATRVITALSDFEKCSTSDCTQDAIGVTLHDGVLTYHCAVHVG